MNNITKIGFVTIFVTVLAVGGWIAITHASAAKLPMPSGQHPSIPGNSLAPQADGVAPAPVSLPLAEDDRRLLAIQAYAASTEPTPEGKAAAVAAVSYFTSHPVPAALPVLVQNIALRNHPWETENPHQLHITGTVSDPPMEQVFPVIAAIKAYGVTGADAIIDALLSKERIDIHEAPYSLMVETLFRILDKDQLRQHVDQHSTSSGSSPELQQRCRALNKQLFG